MTAAVMNAVIGGLFFLCYAYQFVYLAVPFFKKAKPSRDPVSPPSRRFAVLIAARNEAAVLGQLLDSLHAQDYPAALFTVCVVADNCTDRTAVVARSHGAAVYERFDRQRVGKGYALDWLLARLDEDFPGAFDAYLVLDADNLLRPDYLTEMSRAMDGGCDIVTGYRNSKNYGDNWISAGYALWFLRESQQLNRARAALGLSCVVAGTGFAFSRAVKERQGGWPYHGLTEDTQFTAHQIAAGETIGYCERAVLYDEQPVRFSQSWRQRLRWAKGYFQVLRAEGRALAQGMRHGSFACFDLVASIFPAFVLSLLTLAVDLGDMLARLFTGLSPLPALLALLGTVAGVYGTLLLLGGVTLATEWRNIAAPWYKKLGYYLLFPAFMLTYVPIAVAALFCRVEWKPVTHTRALTLSEVSGKPGK